MLPDDDDEQQQETRNIMGAQEAESEAEEPKPRTETGTTIESSAGSVERKQRAGAEGTEAALGILGAGQPYAPGSY